MTPIRLQLVCDHQMLVDALVHRLAGESEGFAVSHRRSTDENLPGALRSHRPDVVAVDARSVAGHWSGVVDLVAEAVPQARIAVLSGTGDPDDAVLAARRCVSAWLQPQVTAEHVIDVLRVVADGHTVYPSLVLGAVLRRFAQELRDTGSGGGGPLVGLTDRERDVLACLVQGWAGKEIAEHLDMATNTVRTHTNRIFRKLEVHSRLEAVRIARQSGFELCAPRRRARATPAASPGPAAPERMHLVSAPADPRRARRRPAPPSGHRP